MNSKLTNELSRRGFLGLGARMAASATLLGTMGSFQRAMAATAGTTGYRALVCLYLTGGNDGFNTVVPLTSSAYNTYANTRRGLALSQSSLLALNGTAGDGNAYGLHASCPEIQNLFNTGHAAVIGNVGTLVQPTTVAQAQSGAVPLPLQLFSHADQQTAWWTSVPNRAERTGWAGRIADLYDGQGYLSKVAMNINLGGTNYWQEGARVQPYVLGPSGAPSLFTVNSDYRGGTRKQAALAILNAAASDPNLMIAQYAGIQNNAMAKVNIVNSALSAAGDIATPFPQIPGDNDLGAQLHAVARMIKAQSQLGDTRQMFFVRIGGFDTHDGQLPGQASLLSIISKNIGAFWTALNEIGQQNNVTLFTASDFGRTLTPNTDGSDHAWGNHHFVVGGAVKGGYYGTMPTLVVGGPDDVGAGRIVPTTSTDQYAATLARWYGVADADLTGIFPNLANFPTRTLAFLG